MKEHSHKAGLTRKLGFFPVTNIVVANMIGAGIFTTTGLLMEGLGRPLVMIVLWIVGGVIALCGALSYGELGAAIPRAGGEYAYLSDLYHPVFGFLSGWVSFFAGFSAPIAASAIGFSEYFARAFPGIFNPGIFSPGVETFVIKKMSAILVIVIFTFIHARGLELGARVQNVLTVLKVVLICCLIFFGFTMGKGDFSHFTMGKVFHFDFSGWKSIGLALMWIMFAYSGWNASAYMGSEIKNPRRNLPRSLFWGSAIVVVLYFGMNMFYIYSSTPGEMSGVISVGGLAVEKLFGPSYLAGLSLLISFALFSSLSAYIILGPRVYYSMAKDRLFFAFAAEVHPKHGVPSKSILLQGFVAILMALLGTFDQILTYMGFALGIFPLLSVLGVFKLRRQKRSVFRMPGYPLVPFVYLLAGAAVLVLAFFERPRESMVALLTVLMGLPAYWFFKKKYKGD